MSGLPEPELDIHAKSDPDVGRQPNRTCYQSSGYRFDGYHSSRN
ncbi:hypothetical protein CGMCC3_g806 [Colletotrichum fructicola]|nr:uncharacterized protein CGMCC3_g806 [Colletotrichum fructicola]KAE9583006.1 hypothetical protein CGMCC3_g806 [Colletotrichum fructicola]